MKKRKSVEWKLIGVEEYEPEAVKEEKFLLEIKPLIDIGAMLIMKLRNYIYEWELKGKKQYSNSTIIDAKLKLSSMEFSSTAYALSHDNKQNIENFFSLYFLVHNNHFL